MFRTILTKGLLLFLVSLASQASAENPPNVLFIAVDDLRPELACYGQTHMVTPNIDRLAKQGVLFERAYCMVATCGASRAALMTSIRPARKRFVTHLTWAEKDAPDALPLHTHFHDNGYTTISLGKVFHHPEDHVGGWSQKPWRSGASGYRDQAAAQAAAAENRKQFPQKKDHRAMPYEAFDAADDEYSDGQCAVRAISHLKEFSKHPDQPFFLAVGFLKPHLPFCAPQKYWDLYDPATIHLPDNYQRPTDVPAGAAHNSGELRAYAGIHPTKPVDEQMAKQMIHGYYACVSFTDAQVGRLLDALEAEGLAQNTIVVLWGDHGWQLGEHGMWNKHSTYETSMHAPLIVKAPGDRDIVRGVTTRGLVEFIDIYPSLCDLAGLPIPAHVQGSSFVPLMRDPNQPGKSFAISRFGDGDTIRTDTMRYAEYSAKGESQGAMLFDHRSDPNENKNLATSQADQVSELSTKLNANMGR